MRKLRENRKLKESEMPRKDRESLVERRRKPRVPTVLQFSTKNSVARFVGHFLFLTHKNFL